MKQDIVKILDNLFKVVKPHGTVGKFKTIDGKCPGYYVIPGSCLEELLQFKKELLKIKETLK